MRAHSHVCDVRAKSVFECACDVRACGTFLGCAMCDRTFAQFRTFFVHFCDILRFFKVFSWFIHIFLMIYFIYFVVSNLIFFFISISPQISLQYHFNFHLSSQSNINDVVILLQTTADNSWHLFTFQFPLKFHNNTTCNYSICKKKIWKEHFLLKYIVFMHLYHCWCISFLYCHNSCKGRRLVDLFWAFNIITLIIKAWAI